MSDRRMRVEGTMAHLSFASGSLCHHVGTWSCSYMLVAGK